MMKLLDTFLRIYLGHEIACDYNVSVKKSKEKNRKYFELNENESTTLSNFMRCN